MSCNCPKCLYTENDNPTTTEPQRAVEDSSLNNLYCELTWKMQDVVIKVTDKIYTTHSECAYIRLLDPGTVVKVNHHYYFYSCPLGEMNLEGAWTDEESTTYSTYEFLCKVIDEEATVEIVLEG